MKRTFSALAVIAAALLPAQGAAAALPSGFEERTIATGLSMPVKVRWASDGRAFVIEKAGRLKVVNPGATTPTTVLDISDRVLDHGDRGLLGLALDSEFATNRYVYLLYTYDTRPLTPDQDARHVSRLTRIQVNPDNTVVNPSNPETVLLGSYVAGQCQAASNTHDCIPSDGSSHSIGTVISAPDGTLWVGNGDAASYSTVDPLAFRTYDEQSLAGKILHVDRNGRGLPNHPFCPSNSNLDHVCTKVHSKGFRNPFRFSLRPGGGLVVGDVGWNTREEIDLIPTGPGSGGRSYGWPCYEGTIRTPGYRDRSECAAEFAKEGTAQAHLGPDHDYSHSVGGTAMGGPEYTGTHYPAGYRGSIFIADYASRWIKRLALDSQGGVASVHDFMTNWGATDLEADLDGNLTYPAFGNGGPGQGSLRRIVYSAGNGQPTARPTATPTSGAAPLQVQFSGSGSSDPNGDPLSYQWDFGDGTPGSTASSPTHTYTTGGSYTASLTVNDGRGMSHTATVAISVNNSAPTATIQAPADEATYRNGEPVTLRGSATDPEQGSLPASALDWQVRLVHIDHMHPIADLSGVAETTFTPVRDHDADSYYEITLTATDAGGLKDTKTIQIRPETASLTLASDPPGAPLSYGGRDVKGPFTTQAAIGFLTTVTATAEFDANGRRWRFDAWSDGGARVHEVTVPASASTLTARYVDAGPAGLVAAYGFENGSGTTLTDLSGNGNHGTVSGASWSQNGRYGRALSFDGVNDWVTMSDSDSLDLTSGATLSAWIRPDTVSGWRTVVLKERPFNHSYALYSSTSNAGRPAGEPGPATLYGPNALTTGSWTHLATTYDGSTVRLYVNGTQVASQAALYSIPTSTMPFRIGGNSIWTDEYFDGLIDDVRVYDRALTATQIRADRDTPLGGGQAPPPDTTAPEVSITAPAGGSSVSGTVNVTATATDDVGVSGVQFRLDGADLRAEDTSAPYSVSWDTLTATNGTHQLTAVARDAAGNTRTSAPVQVTVNNASSTGLVGAYSFNAGSGSLVSDSSGRGNHGTLSGPIWAAAGRNGGALSFDGVNDWVTVPDAPSLDLTGAMTLSAWIRPIAVDDWRTVVIKETTRNLVYGLYSSSDVANRPVGEVGPWGSLFGPSQLPSNTWTHITVTYDGLVERLYLNGSQVASRSLNTLMTASTGPLRIGGNAVWGEYFHGLIDDLRIYNRALSSTEVAADRDTGL